MARMKIEVRSARRMSKGLQPARPADRRPAGDGAVGAAAAVAVQPGVVRPALSRLRQAALRCRSGAATPSSPTTDVDAERRHGGDLRRHLLQQFRAGRPARRAARAGGGRPSRRRRLADHRRAGAVLRPHLSRDRPGRRRRKGEARAAAARRCCRSSPRACRSSGWSRRACSPCATSSSPWASARTRAGGLRQRLPVRGIPGAREEGGPARRSTLKPLRAEDRAAARPLPPEGVRRDERGAGGAGAGARARRSADRIRAAAAWPAASATRPSTTTTSIAMAELSLLPAVRKAAADALIVADGTSCRHQIADGADDRRYTSPRFWSGRSASPGIARWVKSRPAPLWHGPRAMQQDQVIPIPALKSTAPAMSARTRSA